MARFGVAGYPPAFFQSVYKKEREKIFYWLYDLGLDAFEWQMTYGPKASQEQGVLYKKIAQDKKIDISIHASYFIVLTSDEKNKIERSIDTLKRTFELANFIGSKIIVLHPGPLYSGNSKDALNRVIENLDTFFYQLGKTEIGLYVETAGKKGQLGSVEEIFEISKNFDSCFPCLDFGHIHARTVGTLSNNLAIDSLFDHIRNFQNNFKQKIHFHYTPIDYGAKGEIKHKKINDYYPDSDQISLELLTPNVPNPGDLYHPRFERIVENITKHEIDCTVISETHDSQEIGALAMKTYYNSINHK